jgi:hypothetical protein
MKEQTPFLLPDVAADPEPPVATFVTKDGRLMRMFLSERAEVTLEIEGRSNPLRFDRWQSLALLELCKEHA